MFKNLLSATTIFAAGSVTVHAAYESNQDLTSYEVENSENEMMETIEESSFTTYDADGVVTGGGMFVPDIGSFDHKVTRKTETTTGGGSFWVSYPRDDQHRSHHTNPTYSHRSSVTNDYGKANPGHVMRSDWYAKGTSGQQGAQATIYSQGYIPLPGVKSPNTAHWNIR